MFAAPEVAACLLQIPPSCSAGLLLPPLHPLPVYFLQLKSVIRRTKESSNVHPMYRDGLLRRKMGPIIVNKSNSQDRLIEELQGKLGIGRGERPVRRKQPPDDWLTEGVIVMSNPQRAREERANPPVDKVAPRPPGSRPTRRFTLLCHFHLRFLFLSLLLSVSPLSPFSFLPPPSTLPDPPPSRISHPTEESPPPTAVPPGAQKAGPGQADSSPAAPATSPPAPQPSPASAAVTSPAAATQGAHASPAQGAQSSTCPSVAQPPSQACHAPSASPASQGFRVSRLSDRV